MLSATQILTAEDRKDRKRLQNRLNQRARRQRVNKDKDNSSAKPFRVDRWRLGEEAGPWIQTSPRFIDSSEHVADDREALRHADRPTLQSPTQVSVTPSRAPPVLQPESTRNVEPPLPADHALIHLITHNVCRGFMENKTILRLMASFIMAIHDPPLPPDLAVGCDIVVIRTTDRTIPASLSPTQLQMNSPHPSWMDILPFPELRDNLIRRQYMFDHKRFLRDLVGDLVSLMPSDPGQEGSLPITSLRMNRRSQRTYNGHGLILWGEPYLKESWEVTPQFVAKWTWAVEGCCDLFKVSNGWRTSRGEDLLQASGRVQP
ncbi:hypothetical protein B0J13DRAFT_596540 [Dactylonectria estremocensis]|uniref:BZIP domain-containing protein n=1 Tax=Dactylonectria estremocensis TaxID=1079267 RepID=A0A9P9J1V5_9HYPO|nr:hypothetical protein B0J13DRAFT_596540 [Dactylonectria estremocensis]